MPDDGNHDINNVLHLIAKYKHLNNTFKARYLVFTLYVQNIASSNIFLKIHQDESLIHLMIKDSSIVIITFN
jgi:disulfide oxidoreductase YuzD